MMLLEVCGSEMEKYLLSLDLLGYDVGKLTNVKKIVVDKRGYSEDIAAILGKDYIKDGIIIVSPGQGDADLLDRSFSFTDELLEKFYEENDGLIKLVTKNDAIYGKIKITQNPHAGFNVSLDLDTPNGDLKKAQEIRKKIEAVDSDSILDSGYLNETVKRVKDLRQTYGDIKNLFTSTTSVSVLSFRGGDAYHLNNGTYVTISEDEIKRPTKALNKLIEFGYVILDEGLVNESLKKIEEKSLTENGINPSGLKRFEYYHELEKIKDRLGREWHELVNVKKTKNLKKLRLKTKLMLIRPILSDPILEEILSEIGKRAK